MHFYKKSASLFGTAAFVMLAAASAHAASDTIRVDCGNLTGPYTDSKGRVWAADSGFDGGTVYAPNNPPDIAGTSDPALHQNERYGNAVDFSYNFYMNPGSYRVYLYNASLYDGACGPGTRVFDVSINGTKVLTDYDMGAEVECLTAQIKHFPVTTGSDGKITITFHVGTVQNPKINAIEIVPLAGSPIAQASAKVGLGRFSVATSNGGLVVNSLAEGAYKLELKNLQGKVIDSKAGFGAGSQSFTNLRPGLYLLTTVNGNETVTRKVNVLR